jgi:hypothetical protein
LQRIRGSGFDSHNENASPMLAFCFFSTGLNTAIADD